ncbi:hypothetical protein PR002_g18084 [Phytophthora rubi]|uniref:RRM domain-containing protein n=1 Tax=Phytophthora rubi TaxID=129364 RepID=A0A6A3JZV4_9STRA|nr:hypothetical protein PR002_g18084 [Phytophthora rubi]
MAPPNVDSMFTLKVDNVPFQIGDELRDLFSKFGEIGDVYIPRARDSNESRGFAFVRFMEKRDAEDAIDGMEGQDFQGRDLRVQFAKQRRPDNPREFYSRSGGASGGGGGDRYGGGGDRYGGGGDRYGGGGDRYGGGGDRYGDDRGRSSRYGDDRRDDRPRRRSPDRRERGGSSAGRDRSRSPRPRSRSPRRSASPPPRRD